MSSASSPAAPANRLARERSPYLRQHMHNPVDWYPWGQEAFDAARRRGVPIFLSIGYSTCYWCHVMERESFEDQRTAAIMNERFVNIKLDREEHPAVDDLYMAAVQILTGRGGWPMSVFVDPETLRPYWAGTYFPREGMHGLPSFGQVLTGMSEAFKTRRDDVRTQAAQVAAAVTEKIAADQKRAVHIGRPQSAMAAQTLLTILDRVHGGFGEAPKFPQPVYLELLLDLRARAADAPTRDAIDGALVLTLDKMAIGGLFDQVGGGFHRYSVDRFWTVPHFEKMLYDQGQLLAVYARAARAYQDEYYAQIARRTADYVLSEMTHAAGAFFTAQDAEVDGREGLNYLWTHDQLRATLPAEDAELAADVYGVLAGPNFRDPHHPQEPPRNVLRLGDRPEVTAGRLNLTPAALSQRLARVNQRLYTARAARKQPRLDDKVLSAWNGLMIAGLADAGRLLDEPSYAAVALKAAQWIWTHLRDAQGGLLRTAPGAGQTPIAGVLEDYAMFVQGLLALARACEPPARSQCLIQAVTLVRIAEERFGDASGGFYDTPADRSDLFVRARSTYDGAMPSAVSVMLNNLVDLAELTGERVWGHRAAAAAAAISAALAESPIATANSTRGVLRLIALDEPALVEALTAAGATDGGHAVTRTALDAAPVEVYASEESIMVGPDEPAEFMLQVKIADGYHLAAAAPGEDDQDLGLAPLRISVTSGSGVAVYADYPEGEPLESRESDAVDAVRAARVYRGTLTFPVAVERQGEWTGEPRLALHYQACTDTECQAAVTTMLDLTILRKA